VQNGFLPKLWRAKSSDFWFAEDARELKVLTDLLRDVCVL